MRGRSSDLYWGTVIGAPDPGALARFYSRLLEWSIYHEEPGDFVILAPPEGVAYLAFQFEPDHVPPTWPPRPGQQQMMMHLDIEVNDLGTAVTDAVEHGAILADHQPQDKVRVLLDPAGHPFCLYLDDSEE